MAGRPPAPRYVQLRTATRGEPDRGEGSRTITIEQDEASPGDANEDQEHGDNFEAGVLRLRGGPTHGNRVTWQEGTVDNEFLNRKKSKMKRFEDPFADSSDSDSDSSDDDDDEDSEAEEGGQENGISKGNCSCSESDSGSDGEKDVIGKGKGKASDVLNEDANQQQEHRRQHHVCDYHQPYQHKHTEDCKYYHNQQGNKTKKKKESVEKPSRIPRNAYERQPKYGKAKKEKKVKRSSKGSSTMTITQQQEDRENSAPTPTPDA